MVLIPIIQVLNDVCLMVLFLERNIKSNIKLFPDYIILFSTVRNHEVSANDLNQDLGVIRQWAHQWKLEFNTDPTKQDTGLLFSCEKSSPNHPQIMFNGTVVAEMNDQIHLGLILGSSLSIKNNLMKRI